MPIEHLDYRRRARSPTLKRRLLVCAILAGLVVAGTSMDVFAAIVQSIEPV